MLLAEVLIYCFIKIKPQESGSGSDHIGMLSISFSKLDEAKFVSGMFVAIGVLFMKN